MAPALLSYSTVEKNKVAVELHGTSVYTSPQPALDAFSSEPVLVSPNWTAISQSIFIWPTKRRGMAVVREADFEATLPGFKFQFYHLLAL